MTDKKSEPKPGISTILEMLAQMKTAMALAELETTEEGKQAVLKREMAKVIRPWKKQPKETQK